MAKILFCTLLSAFLWVSGVQAAETEQGGNVVQAETNTMKEQVNSKMDELRNAVDGVFDVEYNGDVLSRLKIKYTMEVSPTMRGARGDRLARESATRRARAEFSTFLKNNVVFVESGNEGSLELVENDKMSSKYTQASATSVNTASQSFQRGLISIFQECTGQGENRTCTVVLGWSQKLVNASRTAQAVMTPDPAPSKQDAAKLAAPAAPATAPVEEKRGTSTKTGDMDF